MLRPLIPSSMSFRRVNFTCDDGTNFFSLNYSNDTPNSIPTFFDYDNMKTFVLIKKNIQLENVL